MEPPGEPNPSGVWSMFKCGFLSLWFFFFLFTFVAAMTVMTVSSDKERENSHKADKLVLISIPTLGPSLTAISLFSYSETDQSDGQSSPLYPKLCYGCKTPIVDEYRLRVSPDLEWHASCLVCSECQVNLDENCTCFLKDGRPYCKKDYFRYENKENV